MKVILRQDVMNLGKLGDIVNVKDGYYRNYLFPRELAFLATESAIKRLENEKKKQEIKLAEEKDQAEAIAVKMNELQVEISMKVGEENRLYGSVTPQMIADEMAKKGFNVDRHIIVIEDAIKSLGVFEVKVRLHPEVVATIKVWVTNEEEEEN